jgi:3-oxoacyl-[acyl-carrier protein] reductase
VSERGPALVLGGSGAVGAAVVKLFAGAGVRTTFTYHAGRELAERLARAVRVDLTAGEPARALVRELDEAGALPRVLVHCAATAGTDAWLEASEERWQAELAVNATSAIGACRELVARLPAGAGADLVLAGGLDRTQSLPVPVPYAAAQGLLAAFVMAAAKEVGGRGVRLNMVAIGPLEEGLSRRLPAKLLADYKAYSALRRLGKPEEAARAIAWLALENTYMNGKVLPVNGGI